MANLLLGVLWIFIQRIMDFNENAVFAFVKYVLESQFCFYEVQFREIMKV